MKKVFALIICCLLIAAVVCGCSEAETPGKNTQQPEDSGSQTGEVDLASYKVPADAVSIDMSAEDPSTDAMKFVYDDEGKVTQCYYSIDGQEVFVNYAYQDGAVQIYAFLGEIVAADEYITLPGEYDAGKGFTVINGYYFKGFGEG